MVQQHRDEDERKNVVGIIYVRGDATLPQGKGVKIVAHVCNTIGGWGKGFVRAVSARFGREPEKAYRLWYKKKKNKRTFYTIFFSFFFSMIVTYTTQVTHTVIGFLLLLHF